MKKVLVAMSGGVDSAVAALLLKKQGCDVSGAFMEVWDKKHATGVLPKSACYSPEGRDIKDAKKVAGMLGIKLYVLDVKKEYSRFVLDYFKREYLRGRTPNPCVVCNKFVKFGVLAERAISSGISFDFFATGHYAIVEYSAEEKLYLLKKGRDAAKDQSYFLCMLKQGQLSKIIFPLGHYTKQEVRDIAKKHGLPVSEKAESQDFISGSRKGFFGEPQKEGFVLDKKGNTLGRHKGIMYYTIGQRKGLGISGKQPLYVVGIDAEKNAVILGEKEDLYKKQLIVSDVNLIGIKSISAPLKCDVKIRYRHPAAPATIYPETPRKIKIVFENPQRAITPGQAAVFYRNDSVLGGGFIRSVL